MKKKFKRMDMCGSGIMWMKQIQYTIAFKQHGFGVMAHMNISKPETISSPQNTNVLTP
jgi:hypothetical protein